MPQGWIKYQFGLSIFLSAFLLFFIQPLLAKALLPLFGGAGFVWVTAMLLFQIGLLAGYFYAYCLTQLCAEKTQAWVHFFLLAASFYFIPIDLQQLACWREGWPPLAVAKALSVCILVPFAVISASSPLLQHWYCVLQKTPYPYYYYAVSNLGSLLGLLGYPFLIEPFIGLQRQSQIWSWLYLIYALLCTICLIQLLSRKTNSFIEIVAGKISREQTMVWIGLTMLSSAMLISITRYFNQNILDFPLFWVIPLSLYLISFIVTFARPNGYGRPFWLILFAGVSLVSVCYLYFYTLNQISGILCLLALLYSGCMICHGELIRNKPPQQYLTLFYLYIALGGALGGGLANAIAFMPFTKWWDFFLPIVLISLISAWLMEKETYFSSKRVRRVLFIMSAFIPAAWLFVSQFSSSSLSERLVYQHRNVYGNMRVSDMITVNRADERRILVHGTIVHGSQFTDPEKQLWPTTYYGKQSGLGLAIDYLKVQSQEPLKVAVIGLGVGTVSALLKAQDRVTFFELDPDVTMIAKKYFTFLEKAPPQTDIILGDGRIEMQKLHDHKIQPHYNLIVLDAFSGDNIPAHLITKEAIQLDLSLLAPEGILAMHISNRYVDLIPIMKGLAEYYSYDLYIIGSSKNKKEGTEEAEWAILTKNPQFKTFLKPQQRTKKTLLWTDDKSSILPILKFK